MKRLGSALFAMICRPMAAAPAARAFDLTGTWLGKEHCDILDAGVKDGFSADQVTIEISQSGNLLGLQVSSPVTVTESYSGIANPSEGDSNKGEIVVIHCGTNDVPGDGDGSSDMVDEVGRLRVSTAPGGRGTLRGTSIFSDPENEFPAAGTCSWNFKRTSTQDPQVPTSCQ